MSPQRPLGKVTAFTVEMESLYWRQTPDDVECGSERELKASIFPSPPPHSKGRKKEEKEGGGFVLEEGQGRWERACLKNPIGPSNSDVLE